MIFAPKPPIAQKDNQPETPQIVAEQEVVEQAAVSADEAPMDTAPLAEMPVADEAPEAAQAEFVEQTPAAETGLSGINPSDTAGMGYHGQTGDMSFMDDAAVAKEPAIADTMDAQETQPVKEPTQQENKHIDDVWFSDLYFTPEKIAYIRDPHTQFALMPFDSEDLMDFHKALEEGFQGASSYAIHYGKSFFRIERIKTVTGVHYTARRMPLEIPDIHDLSIPDALVRQLLSLNTATGLILICGPTGMGKTTTCSALLKNFLETEGGFAYTIEDPPEMPLDGLYSCKKGGFGVCKQTEVVNNNWDLGLRSALRSKPRYILVGEIRTAETASELLRAATSGHLVISTIHANNLEDGINAIVKYAIAGGMSQDLASDLLARGILAVVHQKLVGTVRLSPSFLYCFANPNPLEADQMRMIIREGKVNLSTLMEAQMAKMIQGRPLFKND